MARISYNDAVGLLTDVEKNRIVACYFAITDPNASVRIPSPGHVSLAYPYRSTLI